MNQCKCKCQSRSGCSRARESEIMYMVAAVCVFNTHTGMTLRDFANLIYDGKSPLPLQREINHIADYLRDKPVSFILRRPLPAFTRDAVTAVVRIADVSDIAEP